MNSYIDDQIKKLQGTSFKILIKDEFGNSTNCLNISMGELCAIAEILKKGSYADTLVNELANDNVTLTPVHDFDASLAHFMTKAQDMINRYYATNFPSLTPGQLSFKRGNKYMKVIKDSSVYCFIEIATGDIFKAASYSAPAKHARGNIYSDFMHCISPYGAVYLR